MITPVLADPPTGSAYLDGKASSFGVVLAHGRGRHPRWNVVEPLRKGIYAQLGYHTLSLQMPISKSPYCNKKSPLKKLCWRGYAALFPAAYKTFHKAIDFLIKEKGVKTVYLMGHSMGSRMATAFLAIHGGKGLPGNRAGLWWKTPVSQDAGIAGFIGVGIRNFGGDPLDSDANLHSVYKIPVLDLYGDGGKGADKFHGTYRDKGRLTARPGYVQVIIPGANHKFTNETHQQQMVSAVVDWLKKQAEPSK